MFCNLAVALNVLVRGLGGLFLMMTGLTVVGIAFPRWRLDGHQGLEIKKNFIDIGILVIADE